MALTGEDAAAVGRLADEWEAKLDALERSEGAAQESGLKAFGPALGQLEMSVLRKAEINERYSALRKKIDAAAKAKSAAESKVVQVSMRITAVPVCCG